MGGVQGGSVQPGSTICVLNERFWEKPTIGVEGCGILKSGRDWGVIMQKAGC